MRKGLVFVALVCGLGSAFASANASHSSTSSVDKKIRPKKDGTSAAPHQHSQPATKDAATKDSSSSSKDGPCAGSSGDRDVKIARNEKKRHEFMTESGYPNGRPGYTVNYVVPLECGGADEPYNMEWRMQVEKTTDKTETRRRP